MRAAPKPVIYWRSGSRCATRRNRFARERSENRRPRDSLDAGLEIVDDAPSPGSAAIGNEALRRIRRYAEAFEAALDYDPHTDVRLRIARLEQQVADLNARMLA